MDIFTQPMSTGAGHRPTKPPKVFLEKVRFCQSHKISKRSGLQI